MAARGRSVSHMPVGQLHCARQRLLLLGSSPGSIELQLAVTGFAYHAPFTCADPSLPSSLPLSLSLSLAPAARA